MVKIRFFVLLLVLILAPLASSSEPSMGLKWEEELKNPVTAVEIADVNGDGKKEIVAAVSETRFIGGTLAGSGKIYLLDQDGDIINESSTLIGPPSDILVVDDLDGDGKSEIVLGIYSHSHVLDFSCKPLFKPYVGNGRIIESIKTADLDNDGPKEIVITAVSDNQNQNGVYVFDNTGKRKWTRGTKGRSYSFAIEDINNDGMSEVVVGTTWGNGPIASSTGYVSVFNSSGGEVFNHRIERGGIVSVAVADLDNDGTGEILAGSWPDLRVFDHEGNSEWNYTTGGRINALMADDINGGGNKEIVIASNDVYVLDDEGNEICKNSAGSEVYALEIKDLDGDGRAEILAGSDRFYVLDSECNEVWNYRTDLSVKGISVDDLDNDGYYEVAVGSLDRTLYVFGSKEHVMGSSADDSYSEAQKLYLAGNNELALNYSRNAKELYQELNDSKGVSRAERLTDQIEGAIADQGNELETANRYYSLAENLSNQQDYLNASRYLKTAIAKYSALSEVELLSKADSLLEKTDSMVALMADSIYNEGSQKHSEKKYTEAIPLLENAREHYFWVKDQEGSRNSARLIADSYHELAKQQLNTGNLNEASTYSQKARSLYICLDNEGATYCDARNIQIKGADELLAENRSYDDSAYREELEGIDSIIGNVASGRGGAGPIPPEYMDYLLAILGASIVITIIAIVFVSRKRGRKRRRPRKKKKEKKAEPKKEKGDEPEEEDEDEPEEEEKADKKKDAKKEKEIKETEKKVEHLIGVGRPEPVEKPKRRQEIKKIEKSTRRGDGASLNLLSENE